jgi:preprotein translocase subunit SecB
MKPKISPQEYRSILDSLELDTLYLVDLNTKLNEEFVSPSLSLDINEKHTFEQENTILKITYTYKLSANDESKENAALTVQAKYAVRYNITKDVTISKEFMKVFSELTLGMLLWPYFRELVNNTVYRMGMPSLVLPLKVR